MTLVRVLVAWLVAVVALPAQPLEAQGFWQPLLGNRPPPGAYRSYPQPYLTPGGSPYRSLYSGPFAGPFSPYAPYRDSDEPQPYARGGSYRTLCVRLCDGFYFPIGYATPSSGLARDADTCSASCGAEAQLFYYPTSGGDIESMLDLTGRAYVSLPNAFKYRKTLVQGCQCRPQPWSEAELQRHRGYAEGRSDKAEARTESPQAADEDRVQTNGAPVSRYPQDYSGAPAPAPAPPRTAGVGEPGVTVIDPQLIIARPPPIAREVYAPQPAWSPGGAPKSPYVWPGDDPRRGR